MSVKLCEVCKKEIKSGNICSHCSKVITCNLEEIKRKIHEKRDQKNGKE